ncbi:MAG: hypothetical protein LAO76_20860 [Acidobacteriia bacterium]|nr:hypothetical protein [Terriglobia bacterium]
MKQSLFTLLVFCAFLPQVFMGQDVKIVVGNTVEYGQRQPILAPGTGAPATPLTGFATPMPTAGISNQGRAGASSYVESPEGVVTATYPVTPVDQNAPVASVPGSAAAVQNPQEETQEEIRPVDLGPSSFVGAQSPQKSISLGEVAASYKAIGRSKNIRIFSNTD